MHLLAQAEVAGQGAFAEQVLFWLFGALALGAALSVVLLRNIVHAALMLVVNLLAIAGLYLALQSSFLSIVQLIVYAGAIMVLFLFVIMLLGVDRDDLLVESSRVRVAGAAVAGVLLASTLLLAVGTGYLTDASRCGGQATVETTGVAQPCVGLDAALAEEDGSSVAVVARTMFSRYAFPFEASALLLVVATLGALVLGRRSDPDADLPTTAEAPTMADVEAIVAEREGGLVSARGDEVVLDRGGHPRDVERAGEVDLDPPEER